MDLSEVRRRARQRARFRVARPARGSGRRAAPGRRGTYHLFIRHAPLPEPRTTRSLTFSARSSASRTRSVPSCSRPLATTSGRSCPAPGATCTISCRTNAGWSTRPTRAAAPRRHRCSWKRGSWIRTTCSSPAVIVLRVRDIAPKVHGDINALDMAYAEIHRAHPFLPSPDFVAVLKGLLEQPRFRSIVGPNRAGDKQ